jgi:ABC-type lipoprotein export system ATPase subunit
VSSGSIVLHSGTFYWDELRTRPALIDIDLHVSRSALALVLGAGGSGKTALLQYVFVFSRIELNRLQSVQMKCSRLIAVQNISAFCV